MARMDAQEASTSPHQLVAMYETHADAEAARRKLLAAGIEPGAMEVLNAEPEDADGDGGVEGRSFWGRLRDLLAGAPDHHHHAYAEGLTRGHAVLVVHAPSSDIEHLHELLESTAPIDFDVRQEQWRAGGWSPRAISPVDPDPFAEGITIQGPGGDLGAGAGAVGTAASRAAAAGSPGFASHTGYSDRLEDEAPEFGRVRTYSPGGVTPAAGDPSI
jgi:hypothetical protein